MTKSEKLRASWTPARRRRWAKYISKLKTVHGMSHSTEHDTWSKIKSRCYNPAHRDYPDYGGRGITVYGPWRRSFVAFFKALGPKPKGTSIDRIDNSKGYVPGNVRWATPKQQGRNKRNTVFVTYKGQRRPLQEWADEVGISADTLKARLKKLTVEEAFTRPLQAGRAWR